MQAAGQTQIDFTHVLHRRENNPESEQHLAKHRFHFTGQCAVVLSLLQKGERLTCRGAMVTHGIGHLPRRIADLRDAGVRIDDEFARDGEGKPTRFKEYFINTVNTY